MELLDYCSPAADYLAPPTEFPPLPAEYPPPPAEFPLRASPAAPGGRRNGRLRKLLFFLAAAAASGMLLYPGHIFFPPAERQARPAIPAVPAATAAPAVQPTAAPAAASTPEPTAAPTPIPTPEKTEVNAVFLSFSDTLEGTVYFHGQQNIRRAHILVWDDQIGLRCAEYDVPQEDIERGFFRLPTLSTGDLYMEHMDEYDAVYGWPDPELQITYLAVNEDGEEEELTVTQHNSYELGSSTRYYAADDDAYWAVPDSFVFQTYESDIPVSVSYSRDDPTRRGEITVWITINGRDVPAELVRNESREESFEFFDETFTEYYGILVLPRPDWAGEHGTAHFTIREYLYGFDEIWVTERDVSY